MIRQIAIIGIAALILSACATQPHATASAPGFLLGLWHGLISPFALVASVFPSVFGDVRIYAFPNSGLGYDFGFMIGAATVLASSATLS